MGRVEGVAGRAWATVCLLLLVPVAGVVERAVGTGTVTVSFSLVTGLVVAYLLCVGPWGAIAAVVPLTIDLLLATDGAAGGHALSGAALHAFSAAAVVALLERRFEHHGPVRTPAVVVEFGVLAAAVLPAVLALGRSSLASVTGVQLVAGDPLVLAIGEGLGVLATVVGLRMLARGQRVQLEEGTGPWLAGTVVVIVGTSAAVFVTGGIEALQQSPLVVMPMLVLALLTGTVAYSLGILCTSVLTMVMLAVLGTGGITFEPAVATLVTWWGVLLGGLLLGTAGDRRRALTREYRTLFTSSASPTVQVMPLTGRITRSNAAFDELVGSAPGELRGRQLLEFVIDPDAADALELLVSGAESQVGIGTVLRTGDGTVRFVRCIGRLVELGGPQADTIQIQLVDLTDEREREQALRRSNDALERFGRRVSHDLKQPLVAIAGYASTLRRHRTSLDADVVDDMHDRLAQAAERAVDQLDDMLRGAARSSREPVALAAVVDSVLGLLELDLSDADAEVALDLAVTEVDSDPMMLRQVLLNLMTNSCKYARRGVAPRISLSSRRLGPGTAIRVSDNGLGIPTGALEAVFDRGERLWPDVAAGRGFGLSDSRELAEEHGGYLRAEPHAGGACFVLWIPMQPSQRTLDDLAAAAPDPAPTTATVDAPST